MRSFLLALIPGMAVAALAGQGLPQSADVCYGYAGPLKASAWQIGNECYVPIESTRAWGWTVSLTRFEAKVEAEGRSVTVPYRVQAGKEVVPLGMIVKQLGASYSWRTGTTVFEVWSVLRSVRVGQNGVAVDSPFPIKAKTSYFNDPPRAVVDLYGARFDSSTEIELPATARISQLKPDVVRIVVESETRIQEILKPQRTMELKFGGTTESVETPKIDKAQDPVNKDPESQPFDLQPPSAPRPSSMAGPVEVVEEGPTRANLRIPLTLPLTDAPRITRPEPYVLRLVLPGAKYLPPEDGFKYAGAVEKVEAQQYDHAVAIEITLSRPMGLEMSYGANEIRLSLIKPKVGNGKLAGKTIVVDAGHGGHDSGAKSPDKQTLEKNLTLKIATKVASSLAAEGATVIMTRKTDDFIPLKERSEIANRNGADFFISCHINSNLHANSTSGVISFHHAQDPIGMLLADCIERQLAKTSKLPAIGVWSDQRIYGSGFAVLRYATMPAVLLELGFINHSSDRARMTQASYPDDVAKAVVRGLRTYLGDVKD
jgi:N-acetylmuramoyl-L-alanine amidase